MSEQNSADQLKAQFSVRIVVCDHYLTRPTPGIDVIYSDFRGSDIKQVPVLRIFGPATDGHKACLHIHGVFPYFYLPCPTSNPEPQLLYQIAASLDKALNIALKQATSASQHVYKISLVKGLPFYGFHNKDHLYLKVFLYNPGLMKQAVELCSNGAILGQAFQPHESHLNFTLQFFIDFNLFGMSNIDLQTVKFRRSGIWQSSHEPEITDESYLKPESICYYEGDCVASHIINRQRVGRGDGIENPGLEEVWNQEKERRKQLNVSMASKSLSQTRINDETETHYKYEQMLLVKMSDLIDKPVNLEVETIENEVKLKDNSEISRVLEEVNYPAESLEGSQLFNAVDISVHLPDNTLGASMYESGTRDFDETLTGEADDTIVDVNVALNCSHQLSQVLLDSEDLELVDMLQDMDGKPTEEDSIMATPADVDTEVQDDSDDAEYSQVFNDETILMEPYNNEDKSEDDTEETSPMWNDSFWDGANITQLDGTCDDDHVKKVRKRKMRPFKLGLARPKNKRNANEQIKKTNINTDEKSGNTDTNLSTEEKSDKTDTDEINDSMETNDSISCTNIDKNKNQDTFNNKMQYDNDSHIEEFEDSNDSMMDLVNKFTVKYDTSNIAAIYDSKNNFEPIAGPSTKVDYKSEIAAINNVSDEKLYVDESIESSSELDASNAGILSFYDMSKVFDISLENCNNEESKNQNTNVEDVVLPKSNEIQNSQVNHFPLDFREEKVTLCFNLKKEDEIMKDFARVIVTPKIRPPTKKYIIDSLEKYDIPKTKNPAPYYSDHKDVGDKVEIGLMLLKLQSNLAKDQKPFEQVLETTSIEEWRQLMFLNNNEICEDSAKPEVLKLLLASNRHCIVEPVMKAPKRSEVDQWLQKKTETDEGKDNTVVQIEISKNEEDMDNSQAIGLNEDEINSSISLEGSDQDKSEVNTSLQVTMQTDGSFLCFGKPTSQKEQTLDSPMVEVDFLTVMLVEVHTSVRGDLHPDPAVDIIQAIFLSVTNDCPDNHFLEKNITEIIVMDDIPEPKLLNRSIFHAKVSYVNSEIDILEKIINLVKTHDPDIMCGYEIENNSWGYILERGQILGLEMVKEISRITEKYRQKRWKSDGNDFEGRIIGRIVFNVWRLFRHELALSSYSFENCMYEILKERVPKYSYAQLFEWWSHESRLFRWIPVEHYLTRLSGTVRMLEKLDIINRTSELARLFGLQWWEVLSRGSQFRVESLMLRAARPLNLVALSPTVRQRAAMRAPECLPLIFEPESRFYADPVIVLDFQSLYPSMMIAYNYCFSTCIGRVHNITGDSAYEFGAWRLRIPKTQLETLVRNGLVHWSPVGVGFVKPSVRRGVLPALLRRILAARQAVKKGMKLQTDPAVKKAMHSRQLGLKLIANVTYGYTAANFSGRMPCVEVGDSVVAKGRETLERAIRMVRDSKRWNAKVVYGDTDSMFVLVPGGNREQAFAIGQEIADAVTADNPAPVALKLEKVYQPCILQTKKRYVGYMYESLDQQAPVYEAKGIETVRRDGCPAGVKLLQRSLCSLFEDGDMSRVKRLVLATLSQLATGTLPVHQLFFTREYHGPAGYRPGASAPPNEIAKRISARDRRAAPRPGQRVPWLVTAGPPNTPLVRLARTPEELTRDLSLTPHVAYYAARVLLPPLHRCLSLLGANVFKWWSDLGYTRRQHGQQALEPRGGIARYLWRARCARCGERAARALCGPCARDPHAAALCGHRLRNAESDCRDCQRICKSCCGHNLTTQCCATECPVFWRRIVAGHALEEAADVYSHLPASETTGLDF